MSYGGAQPKLDSACASASKAGSPSTVASEHQASMHRHIGSAINEALDSLGPLQDRPAHCRSTSRPLPYAQVRAVSVCGQTVMRL